MAQKPSIQSGLLISFDGIDSSGKATQCGLLAQHLQSLRQQVLVLETPDYSLPSGRRLKRLFQGLDGGWNRLPWRRQLALIADNRAEHRSEVLSTLAAGGIVIYDRYVPSSIAHMAVSAQLAGEPDYRRVSARAVADYEYGTNQMPREHISVFLDVPPLAADHLLTGRKAAQKTADEQTDSVELQEKIYQEYQYLIAHDSRRYLVIECLVKHQLLSPEQIHAAVWAALSSRFAQLHA